MFIHHRYYIYYEIISLCKLFWNRSSANGCPNSLISVCFLSQCGPTTKQWCVNYIKNIKKNQRKWIFFSKMKVSLLTLRSISLYNQKHLICAFYKSMDNGIYFFFALDTGVWFWVFYSASRVLVRSGSDLGQGDLAHSQYSNSSLSC